jgi:hypothetical protein
VADGQAFRLVGILAFDGIDHHVMLALYFADEGFVFAHGRIGAPAQREA